jgi:hypothetical protein
MKKIYVGNLSFETTEDDLRDLFASHGAVDSVSIITDRMTGRSRGGLGGRGGDRRPQRDRAWGPGVDGERGPAESGSRRSGWPGWRPLVRQGGRAESYCHGFFGQEVCGALAVFLPFFHAD